MQYGSHSSSESEGRVAGDSAGERITQRTQPPRSGPGEDHAPGAAAAIASLNAHLDPEVRELKFSKMAENPLVFMRGTDALEASFRAQRPETERFGRTPDTRTWILGDLHIYNMGAYRAPSGKVVYGLNDADEVMIGPYTKDVLRAGSSLSMVAAVKGYDAKQSRKLLDAFSNGYMRTIRAEAEDPGSTLKPLTAKRANGVLAGFLKQAEGREQGRMLDKWTVLSDDGERALAIGSNPKLANLTKSETTQLIDGLAGYERADAGGTGAGFEVVDLAKRLGMGCGSLGKLVGFALVKDQGGDLDAGDPYRILILKQQGEPHGFAQLSAADRQSTLDACEGDHGRRALLGIQALQGETLNPYSGSMKTRDLGSFLVTEYGAVRETLEPLDIDSPKAMRKLARQWGEVIASAHCRAASEAPGAEERQPFARAVAREFRHRRAEFRDWVAGESTAFSEIVKQDYADFLAQRSG